jgi:UDP-glucose 4-epimerase
MFILVTGGLGFIGSNLIAELCKDPDNYIYSLDNNFTADKSNMVNAPLMNVKYIYGETRDIHKMDFAKNVELVYHLGEYSRIVSSFEDIDTVHRFNSEGTYEIVRFCQKKGIKLIYAASSSKFGDPDNQHLSPYAWMKAKNVELIKNFNRWFGLKYSIAYFFNVYGDRQIMQGKYSAVIGRFMTQYLEKRPLTVVKPGTQRRDFTHVSDIVAGLVLLKDRGDGEEFQFGTGKNYSLVEIAEAFQHPYVMVAERQGERFEGKAFEDSSTKMIGWEAKTNVIEWIKNFVKLTEYERLNKKS